MKSVCLFAVIVLCVVPQLCAAQSGPVAARAWFTQSEIENSVQTAKPADALPDAPGSYGKGVMLTMAVPVEDPLIGQKRGYISFWMKPNWNGNDGKTHKILRIGDPRNNGLLVEKAATGMLRYVMASPKKSTAARADVSGWKRGQWHHVVVAWMDTNGNGKPMGMPLWIDKVAVDGPVAGDNLFLNPETMADKRVWIGDATSDAVMDELIFRDRWDTEKPVGQLPQVYRDYFRSAPYTKIVIDKDSGYAPADKRAIVGYDKQFSLSGEIGGKLERMTDFTVRYSPWSEFDAKPFIKWSTSDPEVATVETGELWQPQLARIKNGLVTGKSVGKCKLTAQFRDLKATYDLEVIPIEQPDLDLAYVEQLPRYANDRTKDRPDPGDTVTSVAHVFNFGYKPVPAGAVVRFELIPDSNRNFRLDPNEKPIKVEEQNIAKQIGLKEEVKVTFPWTWTTDPLWVRVTVDPDNKVAELCEANNQRCDLNIARPLRWGYYPDDITTCFDDRKINLVGSFSFYDYADALAYRLELIVREAVWPTTSPNGIEDSFRTDNFYLCQHDRQPQDEPFYQDDRFYDGGWVLYGPGNIMYMDSGVIHEYGHGCLNLPDYYGSPVPASAVLLKDENGQYYAGGELMPKINDADIVTMTSTISTQCGEGYQPLMVSNHFWLTEENAGQIQWFRGYRGARFWWSQGRLLPTREHVLEVYDEDDTVLPGAAVYVYHVAQSKCHQAGAKYFYDRPKYIGSTNEDGRYVFPETTDESWDDPNTDQVDGAVYAWNPFGGAKNDTAFTPNVETVDGLLLIKIVSGNQTEFWWMTMPDLQVEFFRGDRIRGVYKIRTSLRPSPGVTPTVRPVVPDAIKKINLIPVAVAPKELTVKCGQEFTMDASKSYDPEGQPLVYRWNRMSGSWTEPSFCTEPIWKGKAQAEPGDVEFRLYVIDGLRASEPVTIKIKVEK